MIAHIFNIGFNIFIFFVICLKDKKNMHFVFDCFKLQQLSCFKGIIGVFASLILASKEVGMEMENVHMCV